MATNGGQIKFDVGFNINIEELNKAKQELKSIQTLVSDDLIQAGDARSIDKIEEGLLKAQAAASKFGSILENSFNKDLGVMNVAKFQQQLQNSGMTLKSLEKDLQGAGTIGTTAFKQICNQILTTNNYIKKTDTIISKMAETLGNTIKWNLSSSAVNKLSGSIQEAWGFTKALDGSLNDIQIVTNKSSEDMAKFAVQANKAAQSLKTTTTAYTDAALTFYQQGLSDEDVAARAETSLKVSNVTGLSGDQSAEYVTAVLNGYKVAAEDAENAMDKLAAVGAATASSLAELSEGMAKVASAANAMGVSEDQLAATLSTVISVTRQDASTVGTAFKTIYARISDIKAGTADAEISLGNYTKKMAEMGFSVLDSTGNMRDLGEVIEEIGGKWATLSREQQISLAQTMAGTRQYNNLIALFDNWAEYEDALTVSMNANGTLQKQQEIYAESLTAKLNELTAAKEKLFMAFVDNDGIKDFLDGLAKVISQFGTFIDKIGGGKTALMQLGIVAMKVFDKQISSGLSKLYKNYQGAELNKQNDLATMQLSEQMKGTQSAVIREMASDYERLIPYIKNMTTEEQNATLELLRQKGELSILNEEWEETTNAATEYFSKLSDGQVKLDFNKYDEKENYKAKDILDKKYDAATERMEGFGIGEDFFKEKEKRIEELKKKLEELYQSVGNASEEASEQENAQLEEIKQKIEEIKKETLSGKDIDLIPKGPLKERIQELEQELSGMDFNLDPKTYEELYTELKAKIEQGIRDGWDKGDEYLKLHSADRINQAKENKTKVNSANNSVSNIIDEGDTQRKAKAMLTLASNIGQVTMAITQLKALGNIWTDQDMSVGDKILQTMLTLSMIIPTVVSALQLLKSAEEASAVAKGALVIVNGLLIASETAEAAATGLVALAKAGDADAIAILNTALKEEQVARVISAESIDKETAAIIANTAAKRDNSKASGDVRNITDTLTKGKDASGAQGIQKLVDGIKSIPGKIKEVPTKIANTFKSAKTAFAALSTGAKVAVAGTVALGAAVIAGAVIYKKYQENLQKTAEESRRAAAAQEENQKKIQEEKSNLDKLAISYSDLLSQYENNTLTKEGLYKQTLSLIDSYDDEHLRLLALKGDYEGLTQAIKDKQLQENTKVIDESETTKKVEAKSFADQLWADLPGWQRDTLSSAVSSNTTGKTIDMGKDKDIDDIKGILNEFKIGYDSSGHIDFSDLTNVLESDPMGFVKALEKNGSDDAIALLSLLNSTDAVKNAIDAQTAEIAAKIDNIKLEDPVEEKGIDTVEEFTNTVDEYKTKFMEANPELSEEDAYKMAYDYVKNANDITKNLATLIDVNKKVDNWASSGAASKSAEIYDNKDDSIKANLESYVNDHMSQGMQLEQALEHIMNNTEYSDETREAAKALYQLATNSQFAGENLENLADADFNDLIDFKNQFSGNDGENPLLKQQKDYEKWAEELTNKYASTDSDTIALASLMESGKLAKIYSNNDITNKDAAVENALYTEKLDNFVSSADRLLVGIEPLKDSLRYMTTEDLNKDEGWNEISAYEEILKDKGFGDQFDTVQDENASLEERQAALQEIIAYLASIAEVENGLYDKEKAKSDGLTEEALTKAYNKGDISEDQYNKKFQGAMDYELEMNGISTEEMESYTEAVKNMTQELDLSDEMVQKISKDNLILSKNLDKLTLTWKDYGKVLASGDKKNIDYAKGMGMIRDEVEDLFSVPISDDFIEDHLSEIQKLAEGDLTVFDELQKAATQDILVDIQGVTDAEQLSGEFAELNELIMNTDLENMEIGTSLDTTGFDTALQAMLDSGALTVDQVNSILAGVGFEPEITWEDVPVEQQSGIANDAHIRYRDSEGNMHEATMQSYLESGETGVIQIPVINGSKTSFKGAPKATTGKKKGGGGGGGGGGSAKADQKAYKDAKPDRYHDVNIALKDINDEMERLNKNRDLLTGADLAASYQKELELLDKQINALTEKQRLQKEEAAELRSKGHTVQKNGEVKQIKSLAEQGVTFDEQGNISNYNEAIINRTNEINQIIDNYNKMSASQQTDELKKQIEDAEFAYDQFMEDISRYETLTQDEMVETANAIADALNKKIELKIEKFSMTIDLKLETREAENDLEDFQSKMEKREKTAAGRTQTAANKFMNYMDKDTGVQAEIDRVNKIKADIQNMQNGGHSDVYSEYDEESGTWVDNIAAAQEDLKKYTEQMMSDMEDMEDLMDEINQGLLDTFDEIQEGFDDQIAGYEAVSDHIEHNISLIEQLYGDESSDKLGEWYDAQYKNSLGKVDMLKKEADFWQKQMENAENDDAYKKAKENWINSMNELNAAVEDTLDTIIASYENSIDQIFDKLNSSLTDGLSLDYIGEEWELMNQNADRYLDTINSTYEVQKLQRKYQQSINDTDSLSAQKKLNDLMQQEISYLEEKDKLTQYDIDRANLKYEIALKQIALEEAQQNKSTLRLKRDSQGNYSYQYAGDEEGVADKQQELADAQNQLYNLDKDAYQQNLDDMYNIYSEFQSKMTEVAKIYGRESEEYEQYRVLYEKQYGDMINGILTENEYIKTNLMQSSYDALALMYETDSESFANMTGLNMESFSEMTEDIVQQQLPTIVDGNSSAIETMIQQMSGEGGFQAVMQNVWSEIQKAAETYQKRIQEISSQSGTDLHDLQVNTDDVLTTLQGWVEENDKIIGNAEASKAAYDTIAAGVKNLADQYDKAKQEAINTAKESTELQKQLNEETWKELEAQKALDNLVASLKEWNNIKPEIKTFKTVTINESSGGGSGSGGGGGGGSSSPSSGTTPSTNSKAKQFYIYGFSTQCSKSKTKLAGPYSSRPDISKRASWQKAEIRSFKSGGYTGRWLNGSQEANGRLALLHQKELVLNEDDTSNLLDTIKELRHGLNFDNLTEAMSSQMKTVQQSSLRTQNQIVDQLSHIINTIDNLSSAIVEQQVSINARFEDARSSQDIMNAIDQLTNRASQMAFNVNRKR